MRGKFEGEEGGEGEGEGEGEGDERVFEREWWDEFLGGYSVRLDLYFFLDVFFFFFFVGFGFESFFEALRRNWADTEIVWQSG